MTSPRTVMIVDDDVELRESVGEFLQDDGYRVLYAQDGAAALTRLRQDGDKPALILLDLMMPGMNGWQFRQTQLLDPSLAAIPVVVMTASRDVDGIEASEIVYKPLKLERLLDVVGRHTGAGAGEHKSTHQSGRLGQTVSVETTAPVLARRQLQESEEKFRRLVTQVQAGIAQTDLTGRFVLTNERYREIVGRSESELELLRMQDITHPDDLTGNVDQFSALAAHGTSFIIEKRYVRPDKSIVWVQNSVSRIDDHDGKPQGIAAVAMDITQRKLAEHALRESEERFRNMADHAPVMVWITDADAVCTYLSKSWYDFTGQTPETGLGFGWLKAVHPDDEDASGQVFAAANAKREPFTLEYRLRRNDGVYRWAIDSASPRFGLSGEFLGYIGSVIDITDRKNAELIVQASEARYRAMFETAAVSLWEEDFTAVKGLIGDLKQAHGPGLRAYLEANPSVVADAVSKVRIIDVNPATLRLLGATSKAQLLDSLHRIFLPESYSVFLEELMAMAENRRLVVADTAIQTLFAERIDVALSIAFPPGDDGQARALVSLTDISSGKTAEREREARLAHMERAVHFSEMFVGILGHDLRNPLSAITMAAGLLESRAESETIARPVRRIVASADRMERMIAQLLDLTRIRLGHGLPLDRKHTDLAQLSRSIVEELEPVHRRPIHIDALGDVTGRWDGDRLSQLLSNLVGNACQHGLPDGPVLVELDGTQAAAVRLEVKNRGVIPADLLPVVFEPMRSGAAEKRAGSDGLGLGLYITQQIALAHGGQIRVDSCEEQGTRFVVQLPRDVSAPDPAAPRN